LFLPKYSDFYFAPVGSIVKYFDRCNAEYCIYDVVFTVIYCNAHSVCYSKSRVSGYVRLYGIELCHCVEMAAHIINFFNAR